MNTLGGISYDNNSQPMMKMEQGEVVFDNTYNMMSVNIGRPLTGKANTNRHHMIAIAPGAGNNLPHGMFNHQMQANSKKTFRIRGQAEKEMIQRQTSAITSSKDLKEFNNGKFI
jgi:hypothetical protein